MGAIAVFLDRDGTICKDVHYMKDESQFELLPKVAEAIKLLNRAGLKVIVVTNQSGIARGYFTEEDLQRIHRLCCGGVGYFRGEGSWLAHR